MIQKLVKSDIPTNRTIRTGSCAFLPQMNEFNSTKSNRNFKSNKHIALAAKEHVESMHQSLRTRLLYGKNNVLMQPVNFILSVYSSIYL
ncbi:unnamed protein product [Schistosoma mattheei]|uniref:Uncharacterized protein n=1 Tax=Schistosoma mattheei TaxID=31246 RepID=A0A183NQI9_9TREM|nr:unnamed protein product [Schistosoma mattheei]